MCSHESEEDRNQPEEPQEQACNKETEDKPVHIKLYYLHFVIDE